MSGLLLVLAAIPTPASAQPVNTLPELWRALGACSRVSGVPAAAAGSEVTVLFSLKRDGSLNGQPRITHSHLIGGPADQRAFVSAALSGIARCLPVPITLGLGGAMAGRPLRLRIVSQRPEHATLSRRRAFDAALAASEKAAVAAPDMLGTTGGALGRATAFDARPPGRSRPAY